MKPKTLMMLAVITFVVIFGAVFFDQEREDKPIQSGELVFPDLMDHINEITEMTIETKDQTVTLVRESDTWNIKEKGGYAATLEKIKPVLIGIAELRIREPKTKNPDLYEKLGLQDREAEGSSSTLITLKSKDDQTLATLLLGEQRPAKGTPSLSEMYIRKPEDPQTWLVTGKLLIEKMPGEWLEKDLVKIAGKRVQRVQVTHPDGETLTVYKDTPDALDFKVRDLPKGSKVSSQFNVNNVATTLAQLTMDDVKKADEIEFAPQSGPTAILETFDGLRLTVKTMKQDETIFGKISAAFDSGLVYKEAKSATPEQGKEGDDKAEGGATTNQSQESNESDTETDMETESKKPEATKSILKPEDEVQKDVTALNEKFSNWLFELPKFRVDNFSKKKQDLITKEG